jgi:Tol biopolymer transport system component/DNA-binding winged helix-turn-helix (wHTH) protein
VLIRFGAYDADLRAQELRKNGSRIKLQPKPFHILAILLESDGGAITREELQSKLWPADTFVDFEHGLNTAVNKLREALNDSAQNPRFIETLPSGYRFIVPCIRVQEARGDSTDVFLQNETLPTSAYSSAGQIKTQSAAAGTEKRALSNFRARWLKIAGWVTVSFCALAALTVYLRPRSVLRAAPPLPVPFTALPGIETAPVFSPDGSRIAFAWNGDPASGGKGFDLYVKALGSETLLRLTQHPSSWISPVWSPDGTQIAFHRMAGADTGLYVVPALGGAERKLHSTRVPYAVAAPISWSPDGKWIGFGEPLPDKAEDRMYLLSVETLEIRKLPHDPKCLHEATPTFSNEGDRLAYICVRSTNEFELYSTALPGGAPKLITTFSNFPAGFAWSADDRRLFLALASDDGPDLREIGLADGSVRRLDFASNAAWPTVSHKGDKLAYSATSDNTNIWRHDLLHPHGSPLKLISSTREEYDPQYSPDGRHIVFGSTRGGSGEIWMSDAAGNNLVQLSKFNSSSGTPRWSPDGKRIAFDLHRSGHFEIYTVDISERVPRKLVTNLRKDISTPNWSRDGKWIYFRSYEAIGHKMYRCAAGGGDAMLLSAQPDGISAQESYDGEVLFFAARNANTGLRMIPLRGASKETDVDGMPAVVSENLWTVVPTGIYFVRADEPRSLCYFDFASKKIREVFHLEKDFAGGLSVSPDGRWLLYSQVDEENSDIMLVDQFG